MSGIWETSRLLVAMSETFCLMLVATPGALLLAAGISGEAGRKYRAPLRRLLSLAAILATLLEVAHDVGQTIGVGSPVPQVDRMLYAIAFATGPAAVALLLGSLEAVWTLGRQVRTARTAQQAQGPMR